MRRSVRVDVEKFHRELDTYRSAVAELSKERLGTSFLEKQLIFWMESARFLISELEIWGKLGDNTKYDVVFNKLQKNLDRVDRLVTQLTEEQYRDFDTSEEDE